MAAKNNAIGSGAVVITANADQLQNGLNQAGKKVESWASNVQSKASASAMAGADGNKGGLLGAILSGAKANPAAVAMVAGLGLATLAINKIVGSTKELAAVGRTADALGVAPERFMALSKAAEYADITQEQFTATLGKVGARVALAAQGNEEYASTLARIGLNASQLQGLSLDRQFLAIGDAINKVPDAGQRAAVAMKLFEEGGLKLLPMFAKGSGEMEKFIAKQQQMGTALNASQIEQIQKAKEALPKISAAFEGLWNKIIVAAAPALVAVGNALTALLDKAMPAFDALAGFIDGTFVAIAATFEIVGEQVSALAGWFTKLTGITADYGNTAAKAGHLAIDVFGAQAVALSFVWDIFKAGAGAVVVALARVQKAFNTVFESIVKLAEQIPEQFRPGMLNDFIQGAKSGLGQFRTALNEADQWGQKQIDNFGQGVARTEAWVDGLHKRLDEKNKVRDKERVMNAVQEMAAAAPKFAAAIQFGTQDAYKLEVNNRWRDMFKNDPAEINKKNLEELQKHSGELRQIRKNTAPVKMEAI